MRHLAPSVLISKDLPGSTWSLSLRLQRERLSSSRLRTPKATPVARSSCPLRVCTTVA